MTRASRIDLAPADPGGGPSRSADSHSRQRFGPSALFSRPRPAERALGIDSLALQLAFDSFREPVPAGHRGCHAGDRHLVYMSRDYAVDLRLQPQGCEPGVLRGELLSRSAGPVSEVPAFLLAGDEIAGYACTGSLGEFRLETDGSADLRLCLLLDAERCLEVPIDPDAVQTPEAGSRAGFFDPGISKPNRPHTTRLRNTRPKICDDQIENESDEQEG